MYGVSSPHRTSLSSLIRTLQHREMCWKTASLVIWQGVLSDMKSWWGQTSGDSNDFSWRDVHPTLTGRANTKILAEKRSPSLSSLCWEWKTNLPSEPLARGSLLWWWADAYLVLCPNNSNFNAGYLDQILSPESWLRKQWRETATSTDSRQVSKFQSMSAVYIAIRWQRVPEDWTLRTMVSFQVCMYGMGRRTN